jgi:TonB family protein
MKISRTSIRWRIPWRFEAESAGELNLLDLRPAAHQQSAGGRWLLFTVLIVVHGGLLGYLIGFARMPREAHPDMPGGIRVELSAHPVSEKQDREMVRAEVLKAAALRSRDARRNDQQPVAAIGLTLPPWPIGTLPEDLGSGRTRLVRISDQKLASAEWSSEAEDAREAPARPAVAEPAANKQEVPDSVGQSLRLLARQSGAFLPEDAGPISPQADKVDPAGPAANALGRMRSTGQALDAPAQKTALMVPLPDRRTIIASAAANHEQSSTAAAGRKESGKELSTYQANVRAHLAAHKPSGGFGAGTVVVAFTLTRSGDVASARILRSRGLDDLEQGALNAVHRAAPFPKPPSQVEGARFHFAIPFRFQ